MKTETFLRFPKFKTKAVTLSFDDGAIYDRTMTQILNRYGIKCTFNLNAGLMLEGVSGRIDFDEVNELYTEHEIACHTYTHPHLDNLDLGSVAYEIIKDREALEEKTGRIIEGFAYPYGLRETDGMIDCIKKCGIKYARATIPTYGFDLPKDYLRWNPTCHQADPKLYPIIDKFLESDDLQRDWQISLKLLYIWGHSYEYKNDWESLEKMCQTIGGHENVWYATNMEVIDYITAFKMLRRSANGKIIYNPTDTDIYVAVDGKNILLKKGETTVLE